MVRAYWERTAERDWDAVRALLHPELVVEWPVSGERFVGREPFVAMNRTYQEGWRVDVRVVLAQGDTVFSEVVVPHVEVGTVAALSVWTVDGEVITAAREYWTDLGRQEPPQWRAEFVSGYDPTAGPDVPPSGAADHGP